MRITCILLGLLFLASCGNVQMIERKDIEFSPRPDGTVSLRSAVELGQSSYLRGCVDSVKSQRFASEEQMNHALKDCRDKAQQYRDGHLRSLKTANDF